MTLSGAILCWGDNKKSKLGLGPSCKGLDAIFAPTPVAETWDPLERVWIRPAFRRVWIGKHHCAAIDSGGRLCTWGDQSRGQLGLGDRRADASTAR